MYNASMLAFQRPSPLAEAPPPAAGSTWTLGETLAEVRRRGARLVLSSRGVRLRHAHRLPDLAEAVCTHAPALALWVRLGAAYDEASSGWGEATRFHALWFEHAFEPHPRGVEIRPGQRIRDWSLYRSSVASRLASGPGVVGAQNVADELASLYQAWGPVVEGVLTPDRALAQAA